MSYKPHLAETADLDKLTYPIAALVKIDGNRLLNQNGKATGRSLKPYKNKAVTAFFSQMGLHGLDGELAFGDITEEALCRNTTSVVNTINSKDVPTWWCFDYVTEETKHLPYKERHALMVEKVKEQWNKGCKFIEFVGYVVCYNREQVEQQYQNALDLGYEGIILRDLNAPHKDGRCTVKEGAYLRIKPSEDDEAIVISLVEALENQNEAVVNELGRTERSSHKENKVGKGMVGMLVCKDVKTGNIIDVGAGKMKHEEREYYWNNH